MTDQDDEREVGLRPEDIEGASASAFAWQAARLDQPDFVVFKHGSRTRSRNRRAQAKYREKQKHKIQTYDSLTAEVSKAHEQLEAERAAFATQKQAWQLLIQGLQQQTHQPGQWVSPDASSLTIKSDDSYQVACLKTPGTGAVLDICFAMRGLVCEACNWPSPSREEVVNCRLDRLFEPSKHHQQALTRILETLSQAPDEAAYARLGRYSSLHCALRKALGWNYMTAGNNLARMVDTIWTQAGIKEFGLPPSNHWQRAAAKLALSLEQSAKIISLRMGFLERRHQARRRLTSLPSRVQAFVLDQPDNASRAYEVAAQEGEHCYAQLRQCLKEDHEALSEFLSGVREQVLTPFQDATLLQSAWPWKLDLLSVAGAVADLAKAELGRKDQEVPSTTVEPPSLVLGTPTHSADTLSVPSFAAHSTAPNAARSSTPSTIIMEIAERPAAEASATPSEDMPADAVLQLAHIGPPPSSWSHHASANTKQSGKAGMDSLVPRNAKPGWQSAGPDAGSVDASGISRTTRLVAAGSQARLPQSVAELPAVNFAGLADAGQDNWLDWLSEKRA